MDRAGYRVACTRLQKKIISHISRKYKFAVEEKEAAVSEAMGRYRKMQRELEDAEERAERAEGTASTLRARSIRFFYTIFNQVFFENLFNNQVPLKVSLKSTPNNEAK